MRSFIKSSLLTLALCASSVVPSYSQTPGLNKKPWVTVISNKEFIAEYVFDEVIENETNLVIPVRVMSHTEGILSFFFVQVDLRKETFGNFRRIGIMVFALDGSVKYQDREMTEWEPLTANSPMVIIFEDFLSKKIAGL